MRSKVCTRCGIEKELTEFHNCVSQKLGTKPRCKDCRSIISKEENKKPEKFYQRLKGRVQGTKIKLRMSQDDFVRWHTTQKKTCYYCGIPEYYLEKLDFVPPAGFCKKNRLEIDRVDSDGHYELYNIVLACPICNSTKSNIFSVGEMLEMGEVVRKKWKKREEAEYGV